MSTPSEQNPPPKQSQEYPGRTGEMDPRPRDEMRDYEGRGLLAGKRALITGGDSGIGRAVAVAFAKEGADVAIAYLSEQEDEDAQHTASLVEKAGHRCVTIRGDLAGAGFSRADHQPVGTHIPGSTSSATSGPPRRPSRTFPTAVPSSTPRLSTACAATRP